MEKSKNYKIGYDQFGDGKVALRIRNENSDKVDLFAKTHLDKINMYLDIANICTIDYINSVPEYNAQNPDNANNLRVMAIIAYYKGGEYFIELTPYDNYQSMIDSITGTEGVVRGKTLKSMLIGALADNIPINFISKVEFSTIPTNVSVDTSIEEYYKNDESLLCRLV